MEKPLKASTPGEVTAPKKLACEVKTVSAACEPPAIIMTAEHASRLIQIDCNLIMSSLS